MLSSFLSKEKNRFRNTVRKLVYQDCRKIKINACISPMRAFIISMSQHIALGTYWLMAALVQKHIFALQVGRVQHGFSNFATYGSWASLSA